MSKKEKQTNAPQPKDTAELTLEQLQQSYDGLVVENTALIEQVEQLQATTDQLNKTIARLQSSADNSDKYRDQLVAMKADFDSYKKRMRSDADNSRTLGKGQAIEQIFPILDTFNMAKAHLQGDSLQAFDMVLGQFEKVLAELGVAKIEALGLAFDANTMNAISSQDHGEDNRDKVVQVYQDGYQLGDKILRYAQVIVGI